MTYDWVRRFAEFRELVDGTVWRKITPNWRFADA